MKTAKLWTRNFRLVILASAIGTVGAIAGGFALAFLVFDETGSTLASALIVAIQLLPHLLLPVLIAPFMDRLPRKSFLVAGDIANAALLAGMGLWLLFFDFSYVGYLVVSLLLACLGAVDELAFTSIYPELIPEGAEQKGYAVSSMLYPVLKVIMTPLAAVLLNTLGVAWILIVQSGLSLAAVITESFIHLDETERQHRTPYSLRAWAGDIREAVQYLKEERGLRSIYEYMAVTNGVASGFSPILVAFFRTFPGLTAAMYSAFSVVEFAGRTIGSALQYRIKIPDKKKYGFVFFVYQVYETMDICLLWLPYAAFAAHHEVDDRLSVLVVKLHELVADVNIVGFDDVPHALDVVKDFIDLNAYNLGLPHEVVPLLNEFKVDQNENDEQSSYDAHQIHSGSHGESDASRHPDTCSSSQAAHRGFHLDNGTGTQETYTTHHLGCDAAGIAVFQAQVFLGNVY